MSGDPFVREAREDTQALADGFVALEGSGDRATVDELFRRAHSLKGTLEMEGHSDAATVAHALEDALDAVRRGDRSADGDLVDAALRATDTLDAMVGEVARSGRTTADPDPAVSALESALGGTDAGDETADGRGDEAADGPTGPRETPSGSPPTERAGPTDTDRHTGPQGAAEGDDGRPQASEAADDAATDDEVAAALDAASEFDDLDALVDGMDDDEAFETLEGGGSFDDLLEEDDDGDDVGGASDAGDVDPGGADSDPVLDRDTRVVGPSADRDRGDHPGVGRDDEGDVAGDTDDAVGEPDDPDDEFEWVKATVDEDTSVDDLQAAVEAESFGEFDDEDTMSIQELIDLDPDEGEGGTDRVTDAATGHGDAPETEAEDEDESSDESEDDEDALDALSAVYDALADDPETDAGAPDGPAPDDVAGADPNSPGVSEPGREEATGSGSRPGQSTDAEATADARETTDAEMTTDAESESESGSEPAVDLSDVSVGTPADADPSFDAGTGELDAFESRFESLFEGEATAEARPATAAATIEDSALATERFRRADDGRSAAPTEPQPITVDAESAETLLSLAERLSIQARALADEVPAGSAADRATDLVDSVERLQRTVMRVRLTPLSTVTDGLTRVVRDVARESGVEAKLTVEGADVQLDRSIIDRIGDPVVHLVRNAVDHGIEPPAEREAAGKPRTGTVAVRARREGDEAVVEVADDGRGIDPAAVREAAVEAGVVDRETARDLSAAESYDLLFRPGLSTAEAVTTTSGRGVGMDVVERTVAALNGDVTVESRQGEGTTVRLRLPVSVVVSEALFVEAGGRRFALPVADVRRVGPSGGARVADGGLLAGATADRRVDLAAAVDEGETADDAAVVSVAGDDGPVDLYCDRLLDRRETVITPYDDLLVDVPGVSGVTTDTGGELVHVLDVSEL